MTLDELKRQIPDYAKDLRLNLSSVLAETGAPGLSQQQIWGVALTSAITSRHPALAATIGELAGDALPAADAEGARAAAAIMGMNNIYYRFLHLAGNPDYAQMPARLRMNVIGNPGIDKVAFELYSLAASAVTGCEGCVKSHERALRKAGMTTEGVQSAARIAAVIHGVAIVLEQEQVALRSAA